MDATLNRDERLTRRQLAQRLREYGFRVSESTLATKAVRGGGPPFQKFGPFATYTWGTSYDWAEGRLTDPRTSTAENDAA
jgi:hypothetical protein